MAAVCLPPRHQQGSEEATSGAGDRTEGHQAVREDSGITLQWKEGRRPQARRQGLRQVPRPRVHHSI